MAAGKCFFFKGDKYVRFDIATNSIDSGYPRLIADDWGGMKKVRFERDLDAAVYWGEWRLYFFKGSQFVLFDLRRNMVMESDPVPIVSPGNWQRFENVGFGAGIDAAVNWGSFGSLYFFKGAQFIRFNMPSNHVDGKEAPIHNPDCPDNWPGLDQDGFDRDLDAALNWGDGKLHFFKGNKFIRFDTATNRAEGVPALIDSPNNWTGLAAAGFASDIDAATRLGGDRHYPGPEPRPSPRPRPKPSKCDLMQAGLVNLASSVAPEVNPKDDRSFTPVTFPMPFPEGSTVIVLPMTQTFNDPDTPDVRIVDVTTEGFKIRMNGRVRLVGDELRSLSSGNRVSETIGWIAVAI